MPVINKTVPATEAEYMAKQLVRIFQNENPPADYVEVVEDSVQCVDEKFHLYKALVRTDVYFNRLGLKQHISNIRFKIADKFYVKPETVSFN